MSGSDEDIQSGREESESPPIPSTDGPAASNGSNSQSMPVTNGIHYPPRNPPSTPPRNPASTPPRNPASTPPRNPASGSSTNPKINSPLLRELLSPSSQSRVNRETERRSDRVQPTRLDFSEPQASTSSASEASILPGAGKISKTEGGTDSVKIPLTEVVEASVPGIIPAPKAVGASPGIMPTPEAEEGNVTEPIPSSDVTGGTASAGDRGGKMPTAKDSVLEDQIEKDDAKVHEPSQISEDISVSSTEPHARAEEDKAAKEGNVSEMAIDPSVAKDLVPEIENSEKSAGPPPKPTEETMEASELPKSAAAGTKYLAISKPEEVVDKISEPKCDVAQTSERVEEAMEVTEPEKSAVTAVESSQVPEPTGEAMETSEPAKTNSGSCQTSKPIGERKEISKPQKSAVTAVESSQVPEPAGDAMETSEPDTSSSVSGQTFKPNEEAKQEAVKIDSKEAEISPIKRPTKRRQSTHSESPSPKKERKTVLSNTLE